MSTTTDTPAPAPHKNELLKAGSNFLRGTILHDLADPASGTVPEDTNQLMKFHGVYAQDDRDLRSQLRKEGKEKAFSFMARVRVPGGVCTPAQWLTLDGLADTHANHTLKITNRQAFQFHGVIKSKLKPTIQAINHALLNTIAACGDVNRNVMCNPNPEQSAVHAAVQQVAQAVSDHLLPRARAYHELFLGDDLVAGGEPESEPIYGQTYLPRKFKTVFAIPPSNDVDIYAHDLGYIAIVDAAGQLLGFNVTVGGGMGMSHGQLETYPRLANELGFCRVDQAVDVAEKIVTVQRDFGDRHDRKHARMKYTIADRGIEWFRGEVERRLGFKFGPIRPYQFTSTGERYGWNDAENGTSHFTLFIENGRVKDTADYPMKTGLREIAKIHQGELRLTPNQHLVIAGVTPAAKPRIEALLRQYKLDTANASSALRLAAMACVALPTCSLALAESERYLPELVTELESVVESIGLGHDAIVIRMTGCPNGCGRPYLAEIAMVGKAPGKYNVYLGGSFTGNRLAVLHKASVVSTELIALLRPLLQDYAQHRQTGERFGDFVVRTGVVKPSGTAQDFHELKH